MRRQLLLVVVAAIAAVPPAAAFAGKPALRELSLDTYGITLRVPASWIAIPPSSVKTTKFAYAVAAPTPTSGFYSNLNLIVAPVAKGETVREWLLGSSAVQYLAVGTLKQVTINGTPGLEYQTTKLEKSGGHPLLTLEYAFLRGARGYLFTYSATASSRAAVTPLFQASAATIRFAAAPPPTSA
ncbi:MAG TPA: hypothetical protein VLV28_10635 [Gaiellaceae bacterium]|nr:hypothetical protein [Gaiellaceae bacterium]